MLAFFLLVYKFETFRSVSIHHLAALVQKELHNSNKKNWDTLMINVDFFGLELEALFLNLVYFHGEDFRVNRSLVKHCLTKLKKNGSRWLSFSTYYYFFYLFCYHAMYWRWRTDETNCHPTFLPNYAVQNTFLKGNLCLYLSSNGFHISISISICNSQG